MREGFVYFVKADTELKIGFSANPHQRLQEHAVAEQSRQLDFLGCIRAQAWEEKCWHRLAFALYGLSRGREWFRVGPRFELSELVGPDKEILLLRDVALEGKMAVVYVPVEIHKEAKLEAARQGKSISELVAEILQKALKEKHK